MGGSDRREFSGGGFRIVVDGEMDTESAERVASGYLKKPVRLDFLQGDGKQPVGTTLGSLATSGWAYVLYNGLRDEGAEAVLNWAVVGVGRDAQNGNLFLVPNRQHFDGGRFKNQALYRLAHVYIDEASEAQDKQEELARQLQAKQTQLDAANQAAQAGDLDRQIAVAKGRAGQGQHAIELSYDAANKALIVAVSDYESAAAHSGKSAIPAGTWEMIAGTKVPADFQLPKPILDATDGVDKLRIGTQIYQEVLAAAREITPDYPGHYSSAIRTQAQTALQLLGIQW